MIIKKMKLVSCLSIMLLTITLLIKGPGPLPIASAAAKIEDNQITINEFDNVIIDGYQVYTNPDHTLALYKAFEGLNDNNGNEYTCPDVLTLPSSLEYQGKEYKVTSIGHTFQIPDNVKELIIPEGITTIEDFFCYSVKGLQKLYLPSTLTKIGIGFLDLGTLGDTFKELNIAEGNLSFKMIDGALYSYNEKVLFRAPLVNSEFTVKSGVTEIAPSCFASDYNIKKVIIPEGVTVIGELAFYECANIEEVILPDSIEAIGQRAFVNCKKVSRITLPANLKEITEYCFSGTRISEVIIPEGVSSIGDGAFYHCKSLRTVSLPSTVESIHQFAITVPLSKLTVGSRNQNYKVLNGALLSKDGKVLYKLFNSSSTYTVPKTVTTIREYAFSNCTNTKKVVLHNGFKVISKYAFAEANIKTVLLPSTITKIEEYAFYYSKIVSINLPDNLEIIENHALSGMKNLTSLTIPAKVKIIKEFALDQEWTPDGFIITFKGKVPPTIERLGMPIAESGTVYRIYVPKGSISAYNKALIANFKAVSYKIYEIN